MNRKEADSLSFGKKNSYSIKFAQKLKKFSRTKSPDARNPRSLIKSLNNMKPRRSGSGGNLPSHFKIGNYSKIIGCQHCYQALNHMIAKRSERKKDFEFSIKYLIHNE